MPDNVGKKFEAKFKEDFLKINGATVDRLYDAMGGYGNISNVSDFIAYAYPNIIYIECKSTKGNTFPLERLTQYDGLLKKKGIKGVKAGALIWFYEKDTVMFVPIETIEELKNDGEKSVNCKKLLNKEYEKEYNIINIPSIKKRVFMDSDYSILIDKEV